MTRKDYVLLAEALKAAPGMEIDRHTHRMIREGVRRAANRIADALQASNPNFQKGRFLAAVGEL